MSFAPACLANYGFSLSDRYSASRSVISFYAAGVSARRVSSRLVGRDADLARLEEILGDAIDGVSSVAALSGEAGLGKSRLLAEFLTVARQRGALVLEGGCTAVSSGELPYAPIRAVLRDLTRQLGPVRIAELLGPAAADIEPFVPHLSAALPQARAVPRAASDTSREDRYESLLGLVAALAQDRVLVLVIEDLHWADRSSLDLLAFLVGNLHRSRTLFVLTCRDGAVRGANPVGRTVRELLRGPSAHLIELEPLTDSAMLELFRELIPDQLPAEELDQLLGLAEGCPYLAEELVAARSKGRGSLPVTVVQATLDALGDLSPDAVHLVRIAATFGRPIEEDLLAAAADMEDEQLASALREAIDSRLLVCDPAPVETGLDADGCYRLRHALAGEAIRQDRDLLPFERAGLHSAVATALDDFASASTSSAASLAGDAFGLKDVALGVEMAHHWVRAKRPVRALPVALTAARAAASAYALHEATAQYRLVLDLWEQVPERHRPTDRLAVLEAAAEAAEWVEPELALEFAEQARALLQQAQDVTRLGHLLTRVAEYSWLDGDARRSAEAHSEASRLHPPDDRAARARVLSNESRELAWRGQFAEAARQAQVAIEMARESGARLEECQARCTLGFGLTMTGRPREGLDAVKESVRLARAFGSGVDLLAATRTTPSCCRIRGEFESRPLSPRRVSTRCATVVSPTLWAVCSAPTRHGRSSGWGSQRPLVLWSKRHWRRWNPGESPRLSSSRCSWPRPRCGCSKDGMPVSAMLSLRSTAREPRPTTSNSAVSWRPAEPSWPCFTHNLRRRWRSSGTGCAT